MEPLDLPSSELWSANIEPLKISDSAQFDIERFNRVIDNASDIMELRALAKQLLQAWHGQRAAAHWLIRQMPKPTFSK